MDWRITPKGTAALAAACFAWLQAGPWSGAYVRAEEPAPILTECYEYGQPIFSSPVASIGEFDAAAYGVTLHQVIDMPEDNAVLYQFAPRDIMCVVLDE